MLDEHSRRVEAGEDMPGGGGSRWLCWQEPVMSLVMY